MKKKVLSVVLALVMVVAFMPVFSFAGSENVLVSLHTGCKHEAEIVTKTSTGREVITHYDTLQEAAAAVASGETATINIMNDVSMKEGSAPVTINDKCNVTINFGKHRLDSEMSGVVFYAKGNLTINDGKLYTTGTRMIVANAGLNLNNCIARGNINDELGKIVITNGEFYGDITCDTLEIQQGKFGGDITGRAITIKDGIFDGKLSNGNAVAGNSLIISGGLFNSPDAIPRTVDSGQGPTISGGIFKSEPPVAFVADGYFAKKITRQGEYYGYYSLRKEVKILPNVGGKVYDGNAVAVSPTATSNSTTVYGVMFTKEFYDLSDFTSTKMTNPPVKAGLYKVVVGVDEADLNYAPYAGNPVEETFEISKANALLSLNNVDSYINSEGRSVPVSVGSQKAAVENAIISSIKYEVYRDSKFTPESRIPAAEWNDKTIDDYIKTIAADSIEVRTKSGAGVTLSEALRSVGTYTISFNEAVAYNAPAAVTDNIAITLADRLLDHPAATLTVAAAVPDKLGLDASLSTVENGVMTLDTGVITTAKLNAIADSNPGNGLVLNINTALTADDVTDIVIPADQLRTLADYLRNAGTSNKFGALKIIFGDVTISIDATALKYIDENGGGAASFRISAENIDKARLGTLPVLRALNPKTAIEELGNGVVCGLRISIDALGTPAVTEDGEDNIIKSFTNLGAGRVSGEMPLTLKGTAKGSDYGVYYISTTSDKPTCLYGDYVAVGNSGKVTFKSSNLSYFVLSELRAADVKPCDGGTDCPCRDYSDLDSSYWYHNYVDYVLKNGIMNGTGAKKFEPEAGVTRAMVVVMLYRLEDEPAVGTVTTAFEDLTDDWYKNAVKWANKAGVVSGYDAKHFGPNDPVTREQLALILYNYYTKVLNKTVPEADLATDAVIKGFNDYKKIDSWALTGVKWANKAGILNGYDDYGVKTIKPLDGAKRQEIAKMFTVLKRDIIDAATTRTN